MAFLPKARENWKRKKLLFVQNHSRLSRFCLGAFCLFSLCLLLVGVRLSSPVWPKVGYMGDGVEQPGLGPSFGKVTNGYSEDSFIFPFLVVAVWPWSSSVK